MSLRPFDELRASLPGEEFVQLEGQWIHFERRGAGDALILLHGFGGSTFSFRDVIDGLAESFDVIALDLNGFGYTQRLKSSEAYTPESQAALVLRLMDHFGIEKAHVAGHSYGGGIAMLLATAHADRVKTLVIIDGSLPRRGSAMFPSLLAPLASCLIKNLLITESNVRQFLESSVKDAATVDDAMVMGYFDRLRVEGLPDAIAGFLSASPQPADTAAIDVSTIRHPTLIIWGEADGIIPISVGEELNGKITGSVLVRFENSGHLPMEEEPVRFIETIVSHLD